ncbi:MAG: NAD-dependent epimerase/dehydratase family protein [Phycisphaerae bacterium]
MRAFVTGATGFIGRRLVERLLQAGDEVTALVRPTLPHGRVSDGESRIVLPPPVRVVHGALCDHVKSLQSAMTGCDIVYHLAARISFDAAELEQLLQINAGGTRNVLMAAKAASVVRTVVVSSACTIGLSHHGDRLLDESARCDQSLPQRNPYMRSKLAAEAHAFEAARAGQDVVVVNPTTVFGPGDRSLNSGTIVRQMARARVMPVPPGGTNVIDVDDAAEGIRAVGLRGRSGRRYILGGSNLRFQQIVERVAEVIGRRPLLVPLPSMARHPMAAAAWAVQRISRSRLITPQIVADTFAFKFFSSRRAESECGWRAQRDFTSTLAAAWDYYRREGLITLAGCVTSRGCPG